MPGMDGSAETMQLIQLSFKGMKFALECSKMGIEQLIKLIHLIQDTRIQNLKGDVSFDSLLKRNPNVKFYKAPAENWDKFVEQCEKYKVPISSIGEKYITNKDTKTDNKFHYFFIPEDALPRYQAIVDYMVDEVVKEKVKEGGDKSTVEKEEKSKYGEADLNEAIEDITEGKSVNEFKEEFAQVCPEAQSEIDKMLKDSQKLNVDKITLSDLYNTLSNTMGFRVVGSDMDLNNRKYKHTFHEKDVSAQEIINGSIHYRITINRPDGSNGYVWVNSKDFREKEEKEGFFEMCLNDESLVCLENEQGDRIEVMYKDVVENMSRSKSVAQDVSKSLSDNAPKLPTGRTK